MNGYEYTLCDERITREAEAGKEDGMEDRE
jgi:hypothetical protein